MVSSDYVSVCSAGLGKTGHRGAAGVKAATIVSNDFDEELSQLAIRQALERYGHYFETVDLGDQHRAEQLGRLGRAVAADLDIEVAMAARPRRDAGIQVCLTVVRTPATPEPV